MYLEIYIFKLSQCELGQLAPIRYPLNAKTGSIIPTVITTEPLRRATRDHVSNNMKQHHYYSIALI